MEPLDLSMGTLWLCGWLQGEYKENRFKDLFENLKSS